MTMLDPSIPTVPTPTEHQVVRVTNEGPEDFQAKFGGDLYVIPANSNQDMFVPWLAMCLWAGHPNALNIGPKEMHRNDEFARLRVRYGTYSDSGCWTTELCVSEKHEPMRHLPSLRFYAIDTGLEVMTVLADVEGTRAAPQATTPMATATDRAMSELQRQVREMADELAQLKGNGGQVHSTLPPPPPPSMAGAELLGANEPASNVRTIGPQAQPSQQHPSVTPAPAPVPKVPTKRD